MKALALLALGLQSILGALEGPLHMHVNLEGCPTLGATVSPTSNGGVEFDFSHGSDFAQCKKNVNIGLNLALLAEQLQPVLKDDELIDSFWTGNYPRFAGEDEITSKDLTECDCNTEEILRLHNLLASKYRYIPKLNNKFELVTSGKPYRYNSCRQLDLEESFGSWNKVTMNKLGYEAVMSWHERPCSGLCKAPSSYRSNDFLDWQSHFVRTKAPNTSCYGWANSPQAFIVDHMVARRKVTIDCMLVKGPATPLPKTPSKAGCLHNLANPRSAKLERLRLCKNNSEYENRSEAPITKDIASIIMAKIWPDYNACNEEGYYFMETFYLENGSEVLFIQGSVFDNIETSEEWRKN